MTNVDRILVLFYGFVTRRYYRPSGHELDKTMSHCERPRTTQICIWASMMGSISWVPCLSGLQPHLGARADVGETPGRTRDSLPPNLITTDIAELYPAALKHWGHLLKSFPGLPVRNKSPLLGSLTLLVGNCPAVWVFWPNPRLAHLVGTGSWLSWIK